ncbi:MULTISPECIES: hypothetical protein [Psychrobacter]|jgi:hypothetical protein|uniref:Uncharacterized protein n=3 Tax=Psychrobacter TaxID=497 RepID=A0A1G6W1E8_9GAMM|nr:MULTISPECIES: hypothetical protein [Psychrobacter]HBL95895.1 hypothetical protein [Psychrobacter sp.]AOY45170.1 hypothetical protein AOT82_2791 [Psychrobacter sp. AntiMn-1]KRU23012.1 hypothetical protein AS194_00840 [Psychrobacter piscatorii]MDH4904459.1 hypothetical protein [Psychrobacter pocilloporae]SDD58855.1 hypothetical protein SAMN05660405_00774 [Psychrobacter pacificensis]|tara:strand:- start:112 stop:363 length:252 start_codon:yes stop_codon:yes gene_type:complete
MLIELQGSRLTQAILERDDNQVWCAVSNVSDDHAMTAIDNGYYELLVSIVSLGDDGFVCDKGHLWQYAVPVKKVELTQDDVGL